MTTNLVTGADGFVGQHLIAELLRRGEKVVGAVKSLPAQLTTLPVRDADRVTWLEFDLEQPPSVRSMVRSERPDRVFHLAALSSVAQSLEEPVASLRTNALGTLYVLDELAVAYGGGDAGPRVLISGSADVYGSAAARHRPLTEECPLEPLTPYAVSKLTQEVLGLQFQRAGRLPVTVARSFNHTGPGQRSTFVAAQLAARIAEIRATGGEGVVRVGNPEVRRDFTDVRDVVRAYVALSERGEPGCLYNVCSGVSHRVGTLLWTLAEIAEVNVSVELDERSARVVDIPELVGSPARLQAATGWAPQIDLRRSLADLLAFMER